MPSERMVSDLGTFPAANGWTRHLTIDLVGRTHFVRVRSLPPGGGRPSAFSLDVERCASILRAVELSDVGLADRTLAIEDHETGAGYLRVSAAWRSGRAITLQYCDAWRTPIGRPTYVSGACLEALVEAARWMTGEAAA